MNVQLIDCTGFGRLDGAKFAARKLVFTKNTRLTMDQDAWAKVEAMSDEDLLKELNYMANTIPSSWEFVNYTFAITGVSRAFTHQFVRTRTASFAQQTMRVLDVSTGPGWDYVTGPTIKYSDKANAIYRKTMATIGQAYKDMIAEGAAIEDARGVLPTNIQTSIVVEMNLRGLADLVRKRSSPRVQGEYRDVLNKMVDLASEEHPWASLFLCRTFDQAAGELDDEISQLNIEPETRTRLMKLVDQMRMTA